ncbi:hypothetical protein EXE41_17485 [Halorubrum sp. SD690R]|jgi:hypothetical protein|uniref:hypothetical protein n=1 Tax=Halorubrum sp. SD690R TaxID=2518117 RepID=UPI0010F62C6E|nr:hypothetical protein [Halorubrum sp. SD690R]TKX42300.1 hypothetical protein EXE41_17485 [Halorubrum sp. SD690R]
MSATGGDAVGIAVGLVTANVAYLFLIVFVSMLLGVTPPDMISGVFSGVAGRFVTMIVAIGGLLTVADLLAVLSFISSISSGM